MTVASEVSRSGPYNGNGVATVFDYEFKIVDPDHLKVVKADANGDEITLTIDADYTVSGVGDDDGSIAVMVAPVAGETITILRDVPMTQETDLENQGPYFAETVEAAFDLAAMRDQQLQEQLDRAVQVPISSDGNAGELAAQLALNITRLAESADEIDAVASIKNDVTAVASIAPDVALLADVSPVLSGTASAVRMDEKMFTGNGVTTTFALDREPGVKENVLVWVGGAIQDGSDYSVSGTTLTIAPAIADGVEIRTLIMTLVTANDVEVMVDQATELLQQAEGLQSFTYSSVSAAQAAAIPSVVHSLTLRGYVSESDGLGGQWTDDIAKGSGDTFTAGGKTWYRVADVSEKRLKAASVTVAKLGSDVVSLIDKNGRVKSAHITHVRGAPSLPNVVYDRIVISGGLGSLRMQSGSNMQTDGRVAVRTGFTSTKQDGTRVAINGSAFFGAGGDFYLPAGLYIHDGVPYQEFSSSEVRAQEAIVMYSDGILRPARRSDGKTAAQYVSEGALWSAGWGPLLVVDGAKPSLPSTEFNTQVSARSVIGQRLNGDYVVLLVEGKTNSYGVTLGQMQDLCLVEGLALAMNLDGGGTTQAWWDTAYAHPSSDDTPRRLGNYLTVDVDSLNPFDTGWIVLPAAEGVTAYPSAGGVRVRQVNEEISLSVGVSITPNISSTAYSLLTAGLPKRFFADDGTHVRGLLSGGQYRPVVLGLPSPQTGEVFARAVLSTSTETGAQGTVKFAAKWSGTDSF